MEDKGLTPVVGVSLVIVITVAAAAVLYTSSTNLLEEGGSSEGITIEDVQVDFYGMNSKRARVENLNEDNPLRITFLQGGRRLRQSTVAPASSEIVTMDCVRRRPREISYLVSGIERTERVERIEPSYCIEIENNYTYTSGTDTYRVFEARAYRNDEDETPYDNKDVRVTFGDQLNSLSKEVVKTTDGNGEFDAEIKWDLPYIPTDSAWSRTINFQRESREVNFHASSGRFQPPNRVRLDFGDGSSNVYQTQEVMQGSYSEHINMTYDVQPVGVGPDYIELKVSANVLAKQGLKDDWDAHSSDSKLLYQVPLPEGSGYWSGPYAQIENLDCDSHPDVSCSTGTVNAEVQSGSNGIQFDWDSLPTDASGDRYVPVNETVEASGRPFVGGLNTDYRIHHGGSTHDNPGFSHKWYRMSHPKRMVYVPDGGSELFWYNRTVPSLKNEVQDFFSSDETINTTYVQDHELVSGATGWYVPPRLAESNAYYSLENPPEFSGSDGNSESIRTVLYEWNDLQQGENYDLNFTVRLRRENSQDRNFMLPIHFGTMGMFPQNGGEARNVGERYDVYTDGMVRYPPYRSPGSVGFYMPVPAQSSSKKAVVYKTTIPEGSDKWRATTYVINTHDSRVENVYLLNSQGEWQFFEGSDATGDGLLEEGETATGGYDLDPDDGQKVQLNLQYQTIKGDQEAPEYDDTEYDLDLTVENGSTNNYDLSGMVDCRPRHCLSYRIGNREEARPIDNMRGNDAEESLFEEDIERVEFYIKNNVSDQSTFKTADQRLKLFKFWTWYMQPYTNNLEGQIDRVDNMTMETLENGEYEAGELFRRFS